MKKSILASFFMAFALADTSSKDYHQSYAPEPVNYGDADLDSLYRSTGRHKDAKRATFGAIRDAQ